MTTTGAGRAPARAVSSFPLWCKGGKRRREDQAKASIFGATRPRPVQRREGGHRGAQDGVTTEPFGRRGPTLVRISVLDVPLQNGQLLAPFPLNIWGRGPGPLPINRTSHPHAKGVEN